MRDEADEQQQQQQQQHLTVLSPTPSFTFSAHSSTVRSILQLESDGTIVSCSDDATLKRFTVDGRLLNSYLGHEDGVVYVIELGKDVIVSASLDGSFKKWKVSTNECIKTIETFGSISGLLRPRNNDSVILSCLKYRSIVTLRISDFEQVHSFDTNIFVYCFCELEDDGILVGGSELEIWYQGMRRRRLTGHRATISLVVELMNKTIASASRDQTIKIWNVQTGQCIHTLEGHTHWLTAILELSDGTLVSSSYDHLVLVWNKDGVCVSKQRLKYGICSLAELDDGSIVTGGYEGEVEIWKTHNKIGKKKLFDVVSTRSLTNLCCRAVAKDANRLEDIRALPLPGELIDLCETHFGFLKTHIEIRK